MSILRNRTQGNFTIIQNNIIRDNRTSFKERGFFLTLCSLPDNWSFSEEGLAKTTRDGKDSVHSALVELEKHGYIKRYKIKDRFGRFESILEIFPEGNAPVDIDDDDHLNSSTKPDDKSGFTVTENPSRANRCGDTVTEKQPQYNTLNKINKSKTDNQECVETVHTLGKQVLSKEDYDDLVRQFGKEIVDYQIHRIKSKPYHGMLRKDVIAEWSQEALNAEYRKASGDNNPATSPPSFRNRTQYDFASLNKFIQNN